MADFLKKLPDGASGTTLAKESVEISDYNRVVGVLNGTDGPVGAAFFASNPALGPNIYVLVGPNGTDDTATIQGALTTARLAGGGEVWALGGTNSLTYKVSQLIIGSKTKIVLGQGVVIQQLSTFNGNLLQNYAVANARTVMDAAVTATSTTLTSATAAFVAGDVGATLWVQGAWVDGEILQTTIASVTNGTTVVMAAAAVTTVAITQASIGPRDTGIVITGGTWDRGNATPSGNNTSQTFRLRRLDNLTIADTGITAGVGGGVRYGISLADVTDYTVERITWNHQTSDGLHITGPARRGVVRNFRGYTGDDMVSLTPVDWPQVNDIFGDIIDCTIEDIRPWQTNNTVVKVLGGKSGSQVLSSKHIRIRKVAGYATNSDESIGGLVWLGDDAGNAATVGGRVDDLVLDSVAGSVDWTAWGSKDLLVYINGSNIGTIDIKNLYFDPPGTNQMVAVILKSSANLETLRIDGVTLGSTTSGNTVAVDMEDNAQCATLMVTRVTGPLTWYVVRIASANNVVGRLFISQVDVKSVASFSGLISHASGAQLGQVFLSDIAVGAGASVFGSFADYSAGAGVVDIFATNVRAISETQVLTLANASTKVKMHAAGGMSFGGGGTVSLNGGQLSSKDIGFPIDTTVLTAVAGDLAYHNNAATTPYQLGPAMYDGTIWRPLKGFMASGTAVLVAGAVTVADTKISATSVIRVFMRTPGGTPGAHFIGALTAATSFQIKSTSGTDTSTVYYEVESY